MNQTNQTWAELISQLLDKKDLSVSQAEWAMEQCITKAATPAQMAGFLIALNAKGASCDEITGCSAAAAAHATAIELPREAVDIVGTGGDRLHTINVSSAAAMVIAGAGVPVIKHGNRAASSLSGASDVMTALGAAHDISVVSQQQILANTGVVFLHAAKMHPGFANIAAVRKELGVATIFNILGPLCNPARPLATALGVTSTRNAELMAQVLARREGAALIAHGSDGMDELTTTGKSELWQVVAGRTRKYDFDPKRLGVQRATLAQLRGGAPEQNAQTIKDVLAGAELGAARDIIVLNAAAGLVAYELALDAALRDADIYDRFAAALQKANESITSGSALRTLTNWVQATQAAAAGA
ncbi:anthranilate phosphoribosyltransferase [Canibacter sp. lx-72]|uniref:anthranilate phosphoribosyltransferase n=1 Tax=Canibacter zhuwentaonis TaxID=2837491 RepID=UPI001BDBEDE8|nr:anthranilate phosphoribosyltransferase [Canibacter zhuwentaonis]MBT1017846.1 anthranilate phosphoribosyltransferase [Canibacter zhuwentaonis]